MVATTKKGSANRHISALTAMDKAAALLLTMEKSLADRLIKHFDDQEVRMLAESAARLGTLPPADIEYIIDEFKEAFVTGSDLQGSPQAAAQLLDGVVPVDKLNTIMSDIAGNSSSRVWADIVTVPETALSQYLSKQHPQVVTYVLSRLTGALAASVLEQLPVAQRVEIMRRMLSLKDVSPTPLRVLETNLQAELVSKTSRNSAPDIHAKIAAVLNKMNRETADAAFNGLSATRPKDAEKIKGLLFTFNDIAKLSEDSRTKLFEAVPVEVTIVALHGADPELQQLILSVQSQRSKRMIEAELSGGRTPPKNEISKAQRAVSERALELVERGVIELGGDS